MKLTKKLVAGSLVSACTMAASSAFALDFYNGPSGSASFTATLAGATVLSSNGNSVPCTSATFTLSGVAGSPDTVSNATFGTSAACTGVRIVPGWTISAPASVSGTDNVTISNITVFVPGLVNKTCVGTLKGTLNGSASTVGTLSPGQFTFSGTLTSTTGGNCTTKSNGNMTSNPIINIH